MITYDELNTQNHKITELSNVILYLIEDRAMCDTEITCDLFFEYVSKVQKHLDIQDRNIYGILLSEGKENIRHITENFMSGSKEIKRIFAKYLKTWASTKKHELIIRNYADFLKETREVFNLVLQRIQDETEHLYPLVREVSGDLKKVA